MFDDTTQRDAQIPQLCCAWDELSATIFDMWILGRARRGDGYDNWMTMTRCLHWPRNDKHDPDWSYLDLRILTEGL